MAWLGVLDSMLNAGLFLHTAAASYWTGILALRVILDHTYTYSRI